MPPTELAARAGTVRVAMYHSQRVWVDVLEGLLKARPEVDVVVAHTGFGWVSHAAGTAALDVVLVELAEPGQDLAQRLADLRSADPTVAVVGLGDAHPHLVVSAVRAGVRGWVEPTVSVDRLVETLRGVARGETWMSPSLTSSVLDALVAAEETQDALGGALAALSAREIDVLCCLVHGMTRREIADRYVLSAHTVRTHINNVLRKLNVHSTLAAVSLAREAGLVESRGSSP